MPESLPSLLGAVSALARIYAIELKVDTPVRAGILQRDKARSIYAIELKGAARVPPGTFRLRGIYAIELKAPYGASPLRGYRLHLRDRIESHGAG